MGRYGPRIPSGAWGLRSQVSRWLGPPHSQRKMQDFGAAPRPRGRSASTRAATMPGMAARFRPAIALACSMCRRETSASVMMSTPVRSSGRALVKAAARLFSYGLGPCKATVPPELPQTLDAVAGRADKDRSDSLATLKREGAHDDPAATLVRPGADRTPPF